MAQMSKDIRDVLEKLAREVGGIYYYDEPIDSALKALSTIVLDALPSVSKELKLTAREKFIWLMAVKECKETLFHLILGEKGS